VLGYDVENSLFQSLTTYCITEFFFNNIVKIFHFKKVFRDWNLLGKNFLVKNRFGENVVQLRNAFSPFEYKLYRNVSWRKNLVETCNGLRAVFSLLPLLPKRLGKYTPTPLRKPLSSVSSVRAYSLRTV